MIPEDIFPVYAQYNEDIVLQALLPDVKKGFYVDVGANHETYHSVTKYFYNKGWSGINIEPIPRLIAKFRKTRPRDANLQLAVSLRRSTLELRDYPEHDGLSTLSIDSKKDPSKVALPHNDYLVEVDSLKNIFKNQKVKAIDFLKIDVEGYEFEVLKSNDWDKYRPTVICIEANHRIRDWVSYLEKKHYKRVIFDGLNEYYLANESMDNLVLFAERAVLLSHSAVRNHNYNLFTELINRIKFLEEFTDKQDQLIRDTQKSLKEVIGQLEAEKVLSLKGKGFLSRLKLLLKDIH